MIVKVAGAGYLKDEESGELFIADIDGHSTVVSCKTGALYEIKKELDNNYIEIELL